MLIDKNKPNTWIRFRPSLCKSCHATCCTMPLEVKINDLVSMGLVSIEEKVESLTKKRIQQLVKELQKSGLVKSYRVGTGLVLMNSKPNGDCLYLDDDRKCMIYSKRPQVCRRFPESVGLNVGHCPYNRKTKA